MTVTWKLPNGWRTGHPAGKTFLFPKSALATRARAGWLLRSLVWVDFR